MGQSDNYLEGFNRLTENTRTILNKAAEYASQYDQSEVLIIHVFLALLENDKGILRDLIDKISIDVDITLKRVKSRLQKVKDMQSADEESKKIKEPKISTQFRDLLNESFIVSSEMNQVYVGSEHLFLAMFRLKGLAFIDDMKRLGITFGLLKKTLRSMGNYSMLDNKEGSVEVPSGIAGLGNIPGLEVDTDAQSYYRDMNELAEQGYYPNISGRDKEIKRLIHILSRKTKNNPILVGDAGVGKTAIVEGFVNKLIQKELPSSLHDKRVLSVDLSSIVAGARLRGDVEERLQNVITEAIDDGDTILFIDEIHNIIGAGSAGGKETMDIANILKPYLTTGELTVIGATTADEYAKYFEDDSALSRRFQPVQVDELDQKSATSVLKNLKKEFEEFHKVRIKSDAIENAVKLSSEFIKDRYLPDKAIDIIDEAAASVKIGREVAIEPELSKLGELLIKTQELKQKAFDSKNLEKASELKAKEEKVIDEIAEVIEGKKSVKKKYAKTVTTDLVKQIIVDWTKIPIAASDISDKKLKDLQKQLRERIVGQDHVLKDVTLAVQRSHLGLSGDDRPLASFLFLGPTGVGKTELAKTIAQELFGSSDLIFQVDMSELMESHSVSRLIGSPPGYIGHDDGGQLTKFVRRKPYSVVLFDEIEKAHPDTLNLLLQVLEEGQLTDGKGRKVSFSNTIVVMTSNIGASEVSSDSRIGFDVSSDDNTKKEMDSAFEGMKERLLEKLKDSLRPEFINRIDVIDVFRGLNKEDSLEITRITVNELKLRLIEKGIVINISEDVIKHINDQGYSKEFGGRNIRRKVQEVIENGLTDFLIKNKIPIRRKDLLEIGVELKEGDGDKIVEFARKK